MNELLNLPPINQLVERKGFFSIASYPRFSESYDAHDIVLEEKRYIVMKEFSKRLNLSDDSYNPPAYKNISHTYAGYVAVEIPIDSIFLGSIDLSIKDIGSDSTQYIITINQILERLGKNKINYWERENETEFPLAYSPSTKILYGLI